MVVSMLASQALSCLTPRLGEGTGRWGRPSGQCCATIPTLPECLHVDHAHHPHLHCRSLAPPALPLLASCGHRCPADHPG